MKKISFIVLVAVVCAMPIYACTNETTGAYAGGACSIKELRNLEKNQKVQTQNDITPKREQDLRPVRLTPEAPKTDDFDCLFGMCLYKNLLGK